MILILSSDSVTYACDRLNPLVNQALTDDASQRFHSATLIVNLAVVVPEIKLRQIPLQVLRTDVVIYASMPCFMMEK